MTQFIFGFLLCSCRCCFGPFFIKILLYKPHCRLIDCFMFSSSCLGSVWLPFSLDFDNTFLGCTPLISPFSLFCGPDAPHHSHPRSQRVDSFYAMPCDLWHPFFLFFFLVNLPFFVFFLSVYRGGRGRGGGIPGGPGGKPRGGGMPGGAPW